LNEESKTTLVTEPLTVSIHPGSFVPVAATLLPIHIFVTVWPPKVPPTATFCPDVNVRVVLPAVQMACALYSENNESPLGIETLLRVLRVAFNAPLEYL
jgi:hypothetical protein